MCSKVTPDGGGAAKTFKRLNFGCGAAWKEGVR